MGLKKMEINVGELEFKLIEGIPLWAAFKPEVAEKEGILYVRNKDSGVVYRHLNNGDLECVSCGSEILGARVAHPVHNGPFPLSGSGQCRYEDVPYCPKCEKKPNGHGSFIKRG
ncbi:MAG: hypothetical protein PHT91_00710 [Candidatus Nanoarchaeia archaeon]|nr:hypothetical protein [Candidatus Nanoarchaeia archaeon]MDD5053780.1 hypothetical protein [Candidatus Nanoarchaeia archaeon]MDD5499380.1 hypothetical protein [Candidatus Nanoarchaeia archaeon]